ncbi:hypothetical protein OF83DRAFT_1170949 [Amylostereum chailletii]|nr:hypothetical protein OF83DRAFT_1170949 [Amylostereum chailletii]
MAFEHFTWDLSTLIAFWLVGPLYGINMGVFVLCLRVLYVKGMKGPNLVLLAAAIAQFSLSTGHVITCFYQLYQGFVTHGRTPTGTIAYFINNSTPEHVAQEVLYITNSLIGDAILIWRLYVIWHRNLWLTIPFVVLCTVTGATGYVALGNLPSLGSTGSVFEPRVHDWLLASWSISIATQLAATLLIAYKVYTSSHQGLRGGTGNVLWILVESGAWYTASSAFLIGFSTTTVGGLFVAGLGQISAIAPTMIIVRAGLKSSGSQHSGTPHKGSLPRPPRRWTMPRLNDPNLDTGVESQPSHYEHELVTRGGKSSLDDARAHEDYIQFGSHPLPPVPSHESVDQFA